MKPDVNNHQHVPPECAEVQITRTIQVVDNIPYVAMVILGAAVLWLAIGADVWCWGVAGLYVVYGVVGAFWIMLFVCPYCDFYATRLCPCGYGEIAARLRPRGDGERFAEKFKKHIPVIVPLWFIPAIWGIVELIRGFSWGLLVLVVLFAVNSFVLLPLLARKCGCGNCPQKQTCPWMGGGGDG